MFLRRFKALAIGLVAWLPPRLFPRLMALRDCHSWRRFSEGDLFGGHIGGAGSALRRRRTAVRAQKPLPAARNESTAFSESSRDGRARLLAIKTGSGAYGRGPADKTAVTREDFSSPLGAFLTQIPKPDSKNSTKEFHLSCSQSRGDARCLTTTEKSV